jgi:hypothetical protein
VIAKTQTQWCERGYLKVLAGYYLCVCGACSLRYVVQDLSAAGACVPWTVQALCFVAAVSSLVYFLRPHAGWIGLVAVTIATILSSGAGEPDAVAFHLIVLTILLLPWFSSVRAARFASD